MATSQKDWEKMRDQFEQWEINGIEQVIEVSDKHYLSTRAEIVAYFKKLHPGQREIKQKNKTVIIEDWKHPLAEALQPFTAGKNGEPQKMASVMRRFQNRRDGKGNIKPWEASDPSKKQKAEYAALGQTYGWQFLTPPEGGYHIEFEGYIRFSGCDWKEFDIDITDKEADELAAHPESLVDILLKEWLHEEDMDEPSSGVCTLDEDGYDDPKITVTEKEPGTEKKSSKRYLGKELKRTGRIREESYL